jgi:iron complex transport system ATP-binding protein
LSPRATDCRAAVEAMERIGIAGLADRLYSQLSGGEQQMVMLSRLLAQDPEVILLDEPTAQLDFANQARVLGLARGLLEQSYTVLAVLHDPNLAFLYADEIVLFKEGRNAALEDRKQAWNPELLGRIYGMSLQAISTGARNLVFPDSGFATKAKPNRLD